MREIASLVKRSWKARVDYGFVELTTGSIGVAIIWSIFLKLMRFLAKNFDQIHQITIGSLYFF